MAEERVANLKKLVRDYLLLKQVLLIKNMADGLEK